MRKRILTILAVLTGLFVTAILVTASVWPVLSEVATGETTAYVHLLPQYFSADPKRVFAEAEAAAGSLDGWQVVGSDAAAGTITAKRITTFDLEFDVVITVKPLTEFVTQVDVRSTSDFAKGDLGQNARNIEQFQRALDDRLGAVRFDPYAAEAKGDAAK